jgi:hypothetical protein
VPVAPGAVTLRCQQTGDEWPITLTANSIDRETVAVVLTLDQSGSMDQPAGTGPTRMQVLKEAALRFVEIAQPDNGIGVVRFDHDAYPGIGVTQIGAGAADPNRQLVHDAVQAHATNPLGSTSIGDGVELARNTIAPVTGAVRCPGAGQMRCDQRSVGRARHDGRARSLECEAHPLRSRAHRSRH